MDKISSLTYGPVVPQTRGKKAGAEAAKSFGN